MVNIPYMDPMGIDVASCSHLKFYKKPPGWAPYHLSKDGEFAATGPLLLNSDAIRRLGMAGCSYTFRGSSQQPF